MSGERERVRQVLKMTRVEPPQHGDRGGRYREEVLLVLVTRLRVRVGPLTESHRIETVDVPFVVASDDGNDFAGQRSRTPRSSFLSATTDEFVRKVAHQRDRVVVRATTGRAQPGQIAHVLGGESEATRQPTMWRDDDVVVPLSSSRTSISTRSSGS